MLRKQFLKRMSSKNELLYDSSLAAWDLELQEFISGDGDDVVRFVILETG